MPYKITVLISSILVIAACSAQETAPISHEKEAAAQHNMQMNGHSGGHKMHGEERMAVHLTSGERQHVLSEMRGLLGSTQGIVKGLAVDDMQLVQSSAIAAGTKGRRTTENNIMHKKMPAEWMAMGMKAHKTMDEIAQMAAEGKPAKDIQLKLVAAMTACNACHAAYYLPEQ